MQIVRRNFDSRKSRARFDQSEGKRDIAFRISESGKKWRRSLDVEKQDGVRAAVEWRKSRQSRKKNPPSDGGKGGKKRNRKRSTSAFHFRYGPEMAPRAIGA